MDNSNNYNEQTSNMLLSIQDIFERYNKHIMSKEFMDQYETQNMFREITAQICLLNTRLGVYSSQEMYSSWKKKNIHNEEKQSLQAIKKENGLTEAMITTLAESAPPYKEAYEDHMFQVDFVTRLKLVVQSAKILWESLKSEMIQSNIELKQTQLDT